MTSKVSDLVAEFLEVNGITTVFGIIGSANSHIFDSISNRGYTEIVCVHHEQAAVLAAGAYYRASGKLSVALVTAGAGSSNAITGVLSNWADSIPCIVISGQEQRVHMEKHSHLRMLGIQGFDSPKMVQDITGYSKTIKDPSTIQTELENARNISLSRRPSPVWIDIPFDVQSSRVERREWNPADIDNGQRFDASPVLLNSDVDYLVKRLHECSRPVIWAGHGVRLSGARESLKSLIELTGIPTLLTWSAIDILHDEHPQYYGRAGVSGHRHANFIIQNCDLLIVMGSRLSFLQTGYDINQFAPKAKIIFVNNDTSEWSKYPQKYDQFVGFDCKVVVEEMVRCLSDVSSPKGSKFHVNDQWIGYCTEMRNKYPLNIPEHADNGFINSYKFIDRINDLIPKNAVIVTDMGTALLSGHYSIRLKPDQTMFTSLGLGEMGYGLPGAVGSSFADKNRVVVCLNCDGGMMMNLQELQTIAHHKLPIKIVVFNNDGYLMIRHTQKMLFGGAYNSVNTKTGVSLPNFYKVGEAFGIEGFVLNSWESFDDIVSQFISHPGPSLLEVFMDPDQDFLPKVKGVSNLDGSITPGLLEEMSPLLPFDEIEKSMISGVNERSKTIRRPTL
jgi:acetolactate synthase I/II/III large subunit